MKLNFGEILRKYRRERDLTQEELAQDIGISSQSVSKWERNDGYPDIEQLPVIANYFGVTIDTLLGNDRADEVVFEEYKGKYYEPTKSDDFEGKINVALEYYRKYPKSSRIDDYASNIVYMINEVLKKNNSRENREKYVPLLKEICERNISKSTNRFVRRDSIRAMCSNCDDEDFDKWYDMCAGKYVDVKYEIWENRLWRQQKYDESRLCCDMNKLRIILHILRRDNRNSENPQRDKEWHKEKIRMLEYFGENGEVPQAWQGYYAEMHFRTAYAAFGCGEREEGYAYLERAFELYPRWLEIPMGTELELGRKSLFGGIKMLKDESTLLFPDGHSSPDRNREKVLEKFLGEGFWIAWHTNGLMYECMAYTQGWKWFDSVRDEDKFKEYLEKARVMREKYHIGGCSTSD